MWCVVWCGVVMCRCAGKVAPANVKLANRRVLKGHFGKIYALHWSEDSKHLVSAAQDGKLLVRAVPCRAVRCRALPCAAAATSYPARL